MVCRRAGADGARAQLRLAAYLVSSLLLASLPWQGAFAFTDAEIREIFKILDSVGDGRVTREEFEVNKIAAIFRHDQDPNKPLTFEQTKVTRAFFDAADVDHNGTLDDIEIIDAISFEKIDQGHKGYITFDDLKRYLTEIGR